MKLKKERLSNYREIYDPFPIMEIDNFLSKVEAEECVQLMKEKEFDEFVKEGRKNIRMGTKKFNNIIKENNILSDIYNFFNDKEIFDIINNKLDKISKNSKIRFSLLNKPKYFQKKFFPYKKSIHDNNYIKKISDLLFNKFLKKISFFRDQFYLEMNYSLAFRGYKLKTHTDKKTRIVVFLLYLNEFKDKGGHLEVLSKDVNINNNFNIDRKFKAEPGKLIIFLSNPISFHNVSKIENDNTKRYFCYGSYTSKTDMNWFKK